MKDSLSLFCFYACFVLQSYSKVQYAMQICDFFLHERFKGVCIGTTGSFPVAVAEPSIKGDHQCSGVKRKPPEDPVKNGVCSRNVRPRRGL